MQDWTSAQASKLVVEEVGKGDRLVLFVHGLGSRRDCWTCAADFLDLDRYRLVFADLPGFGESPAPPGDDYSMAALAAGLETVLLSRQPSKWHLVAHSMGGAVALTLLRNDELKPRSFVCAEGNLEAKDAFLSRKIASRSEQAFVMAYPKWVELIAQSLGTETNAEARRYVESLRTTAPTALYRAACDCWRASRSGELSRAFSALSCRRAYVYGERTRQLRGLPEAARGVDVAHFEVPGEGHFMMANAATFYGWLGHWLAETSG